jgi:hypothetical protein
MIESRNQGNPLQSNHLSPNLGFQYKRKVKNYSTISPNLSLSLKTGDNSPTSFNNLNQIDKTKHVKTGPLKVQPQSSIPKKGIINLKNSPKPPVARMKKRRVSSKDSKKLRHVHRSKNRKPNNRECYKMKTLSQILTKNTQN